ncbi:WD40 repeat domain-containing protein [Leadbetterella sp. DM7]|uniref:WD40 repeat domain-containing protein n=1 Tax=Leadbetterella sp. DM7 TaxID=3235085 RepID=UPI00349F030A
MKFEISKVATYKGHKDSVYDLADGITEGRFLSAAGDGYLVEWVSPAEGVPVARVNHPVYAFEHRKEQHLIWLGENSEGIHLIDTERKKAETFLKLGKVSVFAIVSAGSKTLAGNSLGYIHVIDNRQNTFIRHLKVTDKSIRAIAVNGVTGEFAAGSSDHCIRVYDLDTLQLKKTIQAHSNSVFTLAYRDQFLISSGRDAHITLWDSSLDYQSAISVPAHNYAVNHILPLAGTSLLASCSMDKSIKIWDIDTMNLLKVIDKGKFASHGTSVNRLWWNSRTQNLFSGSDDRTVSEWKLF